MFSISKPYRLDFFSIYDIIKAYCVRTRKNEQENENEIQIQI